MNIRDIQSNSLKTNSDIQFCFDNMLTKAFFDSNVTVVTQFHCSLVSSFGVYSLPVCFVLLKIYQQMKRSETDSHNYLQ